MLIKKINLSVIFLLFISIGLCSDFQKKSDSLITVWANLEMSDSLRFKVIKKYYLKHTYAEPDVIIELTNFHYNLAKKNNSTSEMANALNERSFAYYTKGDTKKAKVVLEKAIALFEQVSSRSELSSIYANLGNLCGEENNYKEAVNYFSQSLTVFREEKVKTGEARMLNSLGLVYYFIDDYELALEFLSSSNALYNKIGLEKRTGGGLLHIASVYFKQGLYEEALKTGEQSLEFLKKSNNKVSIAQCYFLYAQTYQKLENNEKAILFIDKSLEADKEIENKSKILERLIFKASLSLDSDLKGSTRKAEEILEMANNEMGPKLKADLYNLLYSCYKAQNKFDLSLKMHEKYVLYNDTVQKQKNKTAIIRKTIQNDFDAKLYENKIENEKQQAQLKLKNLNRTYAIVFISLLVLAMIFIYFRVVINSNRKKRTKLLEELERLKNIDSALVTESKTFSLDKDKLEQVISRKLNETDWKVLSILLEDPVIPNKEIADKAFLSVDGINSSLRRMYEYFEIKESKYKKISLLMESIKISNS